MIDQSQLEQAFSQGRARVREHGELRYTSFIHDHNDIARGTAIFANRTVYGYPRIGRVVHLGTGLQEQFKGSFWAEEKINGYNVRVFKTAGQVLALTRGGFVCPFTTDRIGDLMDPSVFDRDPDLVICAEIAGPDNPYNESFPPFVSHDVQLFVFDLQRIDRPGTMEQDEKLALIDRYQLPAVRCFGHFQPQDLETIKRLMLQLDADGAEGLVFKNAFKSAKYVTAYSTLSDIHSTSEFLTDMPAEYFTGRILRLALFLQEQGLTHTRELDRRLGDAFLDGLTQAIEQFQREHKVYHTHRCRFRHRDNAEMLLAHLEQAGSHRVQINRRDLRREGEYWVLEFDRAYASINGLLGHLLSGGLVFD
ncbi:MAG: hypothetical protein AMJ69_08470 [Gammaproteobacteria bacterium SG8_47]|nr:MAG: hypothetical protein AMJ69_08470 [Gammaproteobacteria bacterium SG8_47]